MKVIDLSAGIGSPSIGFKDAGFEIVCAVGRNTLMPEVYRDMVRPNHRIFDKIETIDPNILPEVDVIVGKLSYTTFRISKSREKSKIDNEAIFNIIKEKRPNIFMFQTSITAVMKNQRYEFDKIIHNYVMLGYVITYKVFDECDFSGYFVTGKQLYIIGFKQYLGMQEYYFPNSIYNEYKRKIAFEDESKIDGYYRQIPSYYGREVEQGKYYIRIHNELKEMERISIGSGYQIFYADSIGLRHITHNELATLKGIGKYDFNKCDNKYKLYRELANAANAYIVREIAETIKAYLRYYSIPKNVDKEIKQKRNQKKTEQNSIVIPKHRITDIYIEKLKGLEKANITFGKSLTAIMGVNGVGKSTVLHALACVNAPYKNGDDYKFSFFFTPNPDSDWRNSQFDLNYFDENEQKPFTRTYKKMTDRWSPRYSNRPRRDTYYIGIETCLPEIEKEKQTTFIDYKTNSNNDKLNSQVLNDAAYILNKNYECITTHETKRKKLVGVKTKDLIYSSLSMGAGEQRIFKILTLIYSVNQYSLILIDEIDLLLHTTALRRLIEKLSSIAIKRNLQVIFTTHSLEMLNLQEYVEIRYLMQYPQKTMVYNYINTDMIYEMTNQMDKPIEIFVEDLLSEMIIRQIADSLNISSKVVITKYGAASNAICLASGFILEKRDYNNIIIVLDGDVYREYDEKKDAIKKIFSGTEPDHEEKINRAISYIKQFNLPQDVAPEKYIHDMLIEMSSSDEMVKQAQRIQSVDNSHQWLDQLVELTGLEKSLVLYKIIGTVEENPKWENYIKEIREWLIQKKIELGLEGE